MTRNLHRFFSLPLLPFVVSLSMGAAAGGVMPRLAQGLFLAVFLALMGAAFAGRWIRLPRTSMLPLMGCFAVAFLSVYSHLHPFFPENHIVHYAGKGPVIVEGWIKPPLDPGLERTSLTVEVGRVLTHNQQVIPVGGKVRLTVYGPPTQTVFTGDRVRFAGRLFSPHRPRNPATFDYHRFLALRGIYAISSLKRFSDLVVIDDGWRPSLFGIVDRCRQHLHRWIEQSVSSPHGALLSALLIGYRGDIPVTLREVFRRCGTSHLIAISGLHLGIVAIFLFVVIKRLVGVFPRVFLYMDVQRITAILTFWFLLFYLLLTGGRISTLRAFIMAATYLAVLFFRRTTRLEDILILAAFVLLFFQPQAIFDSSFQLTFAAVGGILLGAPRTLRAMEEKNDGKWIGRGVHWIWMTLWITILAMTATFPIVGAYFHRASLIGVFANLFGIPFLSFLILPIGIMAMAIYPLSTSLATYLIMFDGKLVEILTAVFRYLSRIPCSQVHVFPFRWYEVILYYAAFVFATLCLRSRERRERKRYGVFALASVLLFGVAWVAPTWVRNPSLEIFSVRKGTYLAFCNSGGHATIICNGLGDSPDRDDARWVLIPYLLNRRVRKIDALVVANNEPVNLRATATLVSFSMPGCVMGTPASLESLKMVLPSGIPQTKWMETRTCIRRDPTMVRLCVVSPDKGRRDAGEASRRRELQGIDVSFRSLKVFICLHGRETVPLERGAPTLLVAANPGRVFSPFTSRSEGLWAVQFPTRRRWGHSRGSGYQTVDLWRDGAVEISRSKKGWCLKAFLSGKKGMVNTFKLIRDWRT